jgi:EmrB/QacA subfamily drug resistance transporter
LGRRPALGGAAAWCGIAVPVWWQEVMRVRERGEIGRVEPSNGPGGESGVRRESRQDRRGGLAYKWVALSVTTLGSAMAAIDSSIVVLGLPSIMTSLRSDLVTMIWVLMGYILMSTVFLMLFGRLADMFGRVRMYNLGFAVFTLGSFLCALAASGAELVLFRLVQGLGGAMLMANAMAIITEAFPPGERGRAMGINSITWAIGNIVGPVAGGLILAFLSWPWIFLVNVPIGLAGTLWGYLALHEIGEPRRGERFDVRGMVLFSGGISCLLIALSQGISWGWFSAPTLTLFAGFVVLEVLFVGSERGTGVHFIDPSLLRSRILAFGTAAATLQSLSMFAVNFLVVFYLQAVKGVTPLQAALMILPLSVVQSIVGPIGGVISDRVGARTPATVGLILQAGACLVLAQLTATSPYALLLLGLAVLGVGGGLFWSPNTSAVMGAAPPRRLGVASATLATFRQTGMVTSFALALAVAAAAIPPRLVGAIFLGTAVQLGAPVMGAFTVGMAHALTVSALIVLAASTMTVIAGDTARSRRATAPVP